MPKTLSSILKQAGLETVLIPVLPGCITQGRTKEEALTNAKEAVLGFVEGLQKAGEPVPEEKTPVELAKVMI